MTPKQFVAKQLELPEHARVIPDRLYMWGNRTEDILMLQKGIAPYNAGDVFLSSVLYEKAAYFRPNKPGNYRYYLNGVFSL